MCIDIRDKKVILEGLKVLLKNEIGPDSDLSRSEIENLQAQVISLHANSRFDILGFFEGVTYKVYAHLEEKGLRTYAEAYM